MRKLLLGWGDPFLTLRHVRFGSIVLQNDFAHPSAQD
jgi:hypothetical protein